MKKKISDLQHWRQVFIQIDKSTYLIRFWICEKIQSISKKFQVLTIFYFGASLDPHCKKLVTVNCDDRRWAEELEWRRMTCVGGQTRRWVETGGLHPSSLIFIPQQVSTIFYIYLGPPLPLSTVCPWPHFLLVFRLIFSRDGVITIRNSLLHPKC